MQILNSFEILQLLSYFQIRISFYIFAQRGLVLMKYKVHFGFFYLIKYLLDIAVVLFAIPLKYYKNYIRDNKTWHETLLQPIFLLSEKGYYISHILNLL